MMKKKPLSVFHALQREEAHCGATAAAARVDGGCAEEAEAACTPQNLLSVDLAKPSISQHTYKPCRIKLLSLSKIPM